MAKRKHFNAAERYDIKKAANKERQRAKQKLKEQRDRRESRVIMPDSVLLARAKTKILAGLTIDSIHRKMLRGETLVDKLLKGDKLE